MNDDHIQSCSGGSREKESELMLMTNGVGKKRTSILKGQPHDRSVSRSSIGV